MVNLIELLNRHIKAISVVNIFIIIALIFTPIYLNPVKNIIFVISDIVNNRSYYDELMPGTSTKAIVFGFLMIILPIVVALISYVFRKNKIWFMFPYLSLIIISFIALYSFDNGITFIGFYLAVLIFAFFLFYYIADIIIHRPPKTPKPKKPTTDDRIAALEKELKELKNKKDDQ